MVSNEDPSGPWCFSKSVAPDASADPPRSFPAETPTAVAALAPRDPVDLVRPYHKFSIRYYALDSRSKDIKQSWPFPPKSLDFCLKRGVKDLLPPFEPPDLIRSKGFYTCIDSQLHGQTQYTGMNGGKSSIDQRNANEIDHTNGVIQSGMQDNSCSKTHHNTEVAGASCQLNNFVSSRGVPEKKRKLLLKSGSVTNIRRLKDVASNSSSGLDPKASKTCPVCRVFVSTSNTTLNVHIDQCLSVESTAELVVEAVFAKPKMKPRKKQLMVDIYKIALPYTLEDLDRRNGTNWAIELSEPTMNKEVCTKNRGPEVIPEARDDERDLDVYVDSNGIKIRILSKSSDSLLVRRDEHSIRKVAKRETGKSISMSKPLFKSKSFRNKRFKVHGKKCNNILNHLNFEAQPYPNGHIHDDTSQEEPAMHTWRPTESISHGGSEAIRRQICSKRTDLIKNFDRNLTNKASDNVAPGTMKLAWSCMHGLDNSDAIGPHLQSPEEMATTSETDDQGNINSLETTPRWSSKNPSSNSVMPKVPRSSAALAKKKIKEIGRREAHKSDNYETLRNSTATKSSEDHSPSFSNAGLSNDPNRLVSTSLMFQKHKSLLRTRRREFSHSLHGFGLDHRVDQRHVKKFSVSNNDCMKVVKHTQEDTAENNLSFGSTMPGLGQVDDQYDVAQQTVSTHMDYEGDEPATEVQYASASRNTLDDCCSAIISGSKSPENSKTTDDMFAKGCSVVMENRCITEQLMHHAHVSNIVTNNEVEEWQTIPIETKKSSACLTNNKSMGLGSPQDNSSKTSNRHDSNQDHGLAFNRDLSDSPISNTTPIILKDPRTKEKEFMFGSSNQETNSMPMVKEGEHLPNEKTFCCSCRESIPSELQLHLENPTAKSATFHRKQVPQLHIGLRTSSSFSMYQRASTKANPGLVAHNQPLNFGVSAESTVSFPSYMKDCIRPSLQTQLPSPSSPMLRLMGKNLMVMNSEESGHPQAPISDYKLRGTYMPPVSFMPPNYQQSDRTFINTAPSISSHQIPVPSYQAGSFVGTPFHGGPMVQSNQYPIQEPYRNLVPVMHHPTYMMKEVTMIHGDLMIHGPADWRSGPQVSVFTNTVAPMPYHPSPRQIFPRESAVGSLPVFTNISPMMVVSSSSQRKEVMCHNPYMSNQFHANSPTGFINWSSQYSQNLQ